MAKGKEKTLLEIIQKSFHPKIRELKGKKFLYSDSINVSDLSEIFHVSVGKIIAFFWQKGQEITKFQNLPFELVNSFCQSQGVNAQMQKGISFSGIIDEYLKEIDIINDEILTIRPPIVSIMGHIDHGKTTLLDTIGQTQKQKKEAGGITQKISVSQIEFQGKKITFCDTPGHSIFIQMRQRGISLTDLVVLLIDAHDGIMSQTTEVIQYIHQYHLPVIVFLNHKRPLETNNEANLQKLKGQLQEQNLIPIDWGGEVIIVSGSAKDKKIVEVLLENILLLAESQAWKTNYQRPANGIVIDSYLNSQLGIINNLLIQGGQLKTNDWLLVSGEEGKVKRILDNQKNPINQVSPGESVLVTGLDFLVQAGEKFLVINDKETRQEIIKLIGHQDENKQKIPISFVDDNQQKISLVILADTQSSLEILETIIRQKSTPDVNFQIVAKNVGIFNKLTFNLAKINHSFIILFNVKLNNTTVQSLKENNLLWFSTDVIYQVEEKLTELTQKQIEKEWAEKIMGVAEVRKIFYFSKVGNIAGCQIISGEIKRSYLVNVFRQEKKIFAAGKIRSLESNKVNLSEAREGQECGIVLNNFDDFQIGDKIVAYRFTKENNSEKK